MATSAGIVYNGDDQPATSAAINNPAGLWLTSNGALHFADVSNARVRRVAADQIITTTAGKLALVVCTWT